MHQFILYECICKLGVKVLIARYKQWKIFTGLVVYFRSCITHQMLQNKKCFFCMAEIETVYDMEGKELDLC